MNKIVLIATLILGGLVLSAQERTDTISWRGFNVIIETSCFSTKTIETTFDGHRLGEMKQWFYVSNCAQNDSRASSLTCFLGFNDSFTLPGRIQKELDERSGNDGKQSIKIKNDGLWERYDIVILDNVKALMFYQFVHDKDAYLFDSIMDGITVADHNSVDPNP